MCLMAVKELSVPFCSVLSQVSFPPTRVSAPGDNPRAATFTARGPSASTRWMEQTTRSTAKICVFWPSCSWTTKHFILMWSHSCSTSCVRWTSRELIWWAASPRLVLHAEWWVSHQQICINTLWPDLPLFSEMGFCCVVVSKVCIDSTRLYICRRRSHPTATMWRVSWLCRHSKEKVTGSYSLPSGEWFPILVLPTHSNIIGKTKNNWNLCWLLKVTVASIYIILLNTIIW